MSAARSRYLTVSVTYDIVTPESAENGDAEERGFKVEREPWLFRDVVRWIRQHSVEPSCYPCRADNVLRGGVWLGETEGGIDYRTGAVTYLQLHLSEGSTRYWLKALRMGGVKVQG